MFIERERGLVLGYIRKYTILLIRVNVNHLSMRIYASRC